MTFPHDDNPNAHHGDDPNNKPNGTNNNHNDATPYDPYRRQMPPAGRPGDPSANYGADHTSSYSSNHDYGAHNSYGSYFGKPSNWSGGPAAYTGFSGLHNNEPPTHRPDNFLILNILAIFFCCLPGGIIGLYYSAKVNSQWDTGQWEQAHSSARTARTWFWISASVPFIFLGALLLLFLASIFLGSGLPTEEYGRIVENDILST